MTLAEITAEERLAVYNPYSGDLIAHVAQSGADDVDAIMTRARLGATLSKELTRHTRHAIRHPRVYGSWRSLSWRRPTPFFPRLFPTRARAAKGLCRSPDDGPVRQTTRNRPLGIKFRTMDSSRPLS